MNNPPVLTISPVLTIFLEGNHRRDQHGCWPRERTTAMRGFLKRGLSCQTHMMRNMLPLEDLACCKSILFIGYWDVRDLKQKNNMKPYLFHAFPINVRFLIFHQSNENDKGINGEIRFKLLIGDQDNQSQHRGDIIWVNSSQIIPVRRGRGVGQCVFSPH